MDDVITKMLADLGKPSKKHQRLAVRVSAAEYHQLQMYCARHYLSLSEVIRTAITTLTTDHE